MLVNLFIYILLIFLGLVVSQEIFHRYPRFSLWFFSIASIILFPCWILLIGVADWFLWAKVFSVVTGIILLSLLRTTKLGNTKLCQWSIYFFLVFNILEAIIRDFETGNLANYLNATAGILLIVTLAKINTIHVDTKGKYKDLYWSDMTLAWIVGYTLWNWVFIYLNLGEGAIPQLAVLGSALVIGFLNKERWLQARVFTLGTYFIVFHTYPHLNPFPPLYGYDNPAGFLLSLISVGFMVAYTVFFIRRSTLTKKSHV